VGDFDELTEVLDPLLLRARSRVGTLLDGKWRLDVLLGVGGMAAVYAATHRNGHRAAIKILHPEIATNREVRRRFLREGYVANAVDHEGTARVLDDDVDEEGLPFLVIELLDGETLEERRVRAGGALSEDEAMCIADQILNVLAAAHDKGIVHRDLKPENIFVTRSGGIRVLDFGIAKLRAASTASTATRAGEAMGTPAYMPPEQARGLWDQVDAQSDLWAVGAIMYTTLSGVLPHDGRSANEVLLSAMTRPAPAVASVAPHVSPAVARLIDRAMAVDKERRWSDARRMQDVLRRAFHDRNHRPITTAPRLSVPVDVPNRTLSAAAGAVAASLPTTGRAVEMRRPAWRGRSNRQLAVVAGSAATLLVIAVTAVRLGSGTRSPATVTPGSTSSEATAVSETTSAPAVPVEPPVTTLPSVVTATTPSSPPLRSQPASTIAATAPTARTQPTATPSASPTRPASSGAAMIPANPYGYVCDPPFTLDEHGGKHFKAECL
jgi:serine/threonine protein kinase